MGWFDRWFGRATDTDDARDAESVKAAFRRRYALFLAVLRANNQGLGIMSEIEEALHGERLFGLAFVRSRSRGAMHEAGEMVSGLNQLAPGKYEALFDRLQALRGEIEPLLKVRGVGGEGPLVLPLSGAGRESADLVGGKMASLAELASVLHVAVPDGFVLTSAAYRRFMEHGGLKERILERIAKLAAPDAMDELHQLSFDLQTLVQRAEVPDDLSEALYAAYDTLHAGHGDALRLALRSSAVGEDFADISFAGQYRTELNVLREGLITAYKDVVASKYALTAMSYRLARGISDEETPMCVGCLRMVSARCGGVMYTRNPMPGGEDEAIISAVFGLPKAVVDGSAPSDLYVVGRRAPLRVLRSEVAEKTHRFELLPVEGVSRVPSPEEERTRAVLSETQAVALAELGLTVEAFYDRPMDVEWAFDEKDGLVLLQCRPLSVGTHDSCPVLPGGQPGDVLLAGGATAALGVAVGEVHQVLKEADMLAFPKGGVLVAQQSSPRLAPLLSRAAAVVCEQGSVTGHLANVAREFGVPAIFGVHEALTVLTTGMEVTVDADAHAVFAGRQEERLAGRARPRNLMEGSTVLETLREASRLILPLTMLDPDSPAFRPANCATVHDLTRFCHEKVVHEMFRFGKRAQNQARSSKRLVTSSPMQWWVLNLDDGLQGEDRGQYVHLDDIVSIPMLALWDGITAVPWQGPAMDGAGFVSVLFRSTMDRSLDPASPSLYGNRNYFMISRNYCSLHSRFGYHFAQVEGLVGERARENYASFRFQGGAADDMRRQKRVNMVGELLEERGFRVSLREDRLTARLERLDRPAMESGLRVLGYLLMHTRQLDMIMNNDEQVARARTKLRTEMEAVAGLRGLRREG
ncbi:MAG: PEP/pyruvate-binding domain-containing protein [Desulfovibrionaceae bacterium]